MNFRLIVLFVFTGLNCFSQTQEIELHSNWKFRKVGDSEWLPASVPGTVHTDLLNNNKIPDPYFDRNEDLIQWIDTTDWEYECTFLYNKSATTRDVSLLFEGLDTYAEVYINDSHMLSANNMFRFWQVACHANLKEGINHLRIKFLSAIKKGEEDSNKLAYALPGKEKAFTRKAAYHYGWDWGPRFVTAGIWKPVKLVLTEGPLQVLNHHIYQEKISSQEAILNIETTIKSSEKGDVQILVYNHSTNQLIGSSTANLSFDTMLVTKAVIKNPTLWWCNGLGDPALYNLRVEVRNNETYTLIVRHEKIGLRTIELIQEKDSIGKSFYFKLNGKPVFIKGANIIPPDNFLPRVKPQYYKDIVKIARESNMNMLRVWGGGVYPDHSFFNACDEEGILVWQDFMFANTMYPGDDKFIQNVRSEVEEQVIRLRNHASLALWCGNNEVSEGWFNWGWQKQLSYSTSDSIKIWNDYQNLFEQIIPGIVYRLDPSHAYWPSSPQYGWGRKSSLQEGDSHYWGVWWGLEPFSKYGDKVGRFMSEYGFQGIPSSYLFKKISNEENITLMSNVVKHHQKHPTGFETIDHYLKQSYKTPKSFDDYCYVSQLVQAEGMKTAIEAHRGRQPYCMGTLFWQLNDCWPVTSWSSIDYFGSPKAVHYFIKDSYKNQIINVVKEKGTYKVLSIADKINNSNNNNKAKLSLSVSDLKGNIQWQEMKVVDQHRQGSFVIYSIDSATLGQNVDPFSSFLKAELYSSTDSLIAETIHYFTPPKNLYLEKPNIVVKASRNKTSFIISTDVLAKNILLDAGEDVIFSANYFDLLPGKSTEVKIITGKAYQQIKGKIKIKSLYDTY